MYQLRVEDESLPFYIGKGKGGRAWEHLKFSKLDTNRHKTNKIKKAQREGKQILVEFIKENLNEDDAFMWEVFWIAEYGRYDQGLGTLTNMTDGGEGMSGFKHSDASKAKIATTKKSRVYDKVVRPQHLKDLTSKIMTESNPMKDIKPWKHPKTLMSDKALYAWSSADVMFSIYSGGGGYVKMAKSIGQDWTTTHQNIFRKFKSGWVPSDDPEWLTFKNCYEPVN